MDHHQPRFTDLWIEWRAHVHSLRLSLASLPAPHQASAAAGDGAAEAASIAHISHILAACLDLYKQRFHSDPSLLYSSPHSAALASISGLDHSPLEAAFSWLGGWRPTSAFTLVYSTLGLDASHIILRNDHSCNLANTAAAPQQLLSGIATDNTASRTIASPHASPGDATSISDAELAVIESLRITTLAVELRLSDELATAQMLFPDQATTEALTSDSATTSYELMESKVAHLTQLFTKANHLRLNTLQELLKLLNPIHSALCCVSAFELAYALKSLN